MMIPQTPAEGVLLNKNYGDAASYTVACDCTDPTCSHQLWIEAEDHFVSVHLCTTQTTNHWSRIVEPRYTIKNKILTNLNWFWTDVINGTARKLKITYDIWVKGIIKYESCILLTEQQAINYANLLITAVQRVQLEKKHAKS
jgi:hypothetical protein